MVRSARQRAPRQPAARAVLEALEAVAAPEVADLVLRDAVRRAGLDGVPEGGEPLAELVDGPLRRAVGDRIGLEAAEAVVESLKPIVRASRARASGTQPRARNRSPSPTPTPTPTSDEQEGVVLLVTEDGDLAWRLSEALTGVAEVHRVKDLYGLVRGAELHALARPTVVLDGSAPGVEAEAVSSLGRLLAAGTRVIFWRATDALRETTKRPGWDELQPMPLGEDADVTDLAQLCGARMISGERRAVRPVLLVDDRAEQRKARSEALRSLGRPVATAASVAEALAVCARGAPKVVLAALSHGEDSARLADALDLVYEDHAPPVVVLSDEPAPTSNARRTLALDVTTEQLDAALGELD